MSLQSALFALVGLILLPQSTGALRPDQTEYELPGSSWLLWESLDAPSNTSFYSMYLKADTTPSSRAASLHVSCSGRRLDVFIRTSATVRTEHSQRDQQDLVAVRLRHSDEAVTKSYLFSPLEDNHGFYFFKFLSRKDDAERGIGRLLGHTETSIEFEDDEGRPVTALFDLGHMDRLYSSLRQACRAGGALALVDPRLQVRNQQPDGAQTIEPVAAQTAPALPAPPSPVEAPDTGPEASTQPGVTSVFGLSMGLELEEVTTRIEADPVPVEDHPELYLLPRVPEPNPNFEFYLGLIPEPAGLCEVRAVGQTIHTDPQGRAVRHAFHNNVSLLHKIFGPYRLVDTSAERAAEGAGAWMSNLYSGGIRLLAEWSENRNSRLGHDVQKVLLSVRPESQESARLILQVTFSNFPVSGKP